MSEPCIQDELPRDWRVVRFGEIIKSMQLGTNLLGSETGDGLPLLKMGNLTIGGFDFGKLEYLDVSVTRQASPFLLRCGDFLFNTRNTLDLVGKSAVWRDRLPAATFNSNIMRIKFDDSCDDFFLGYYFAFDLGWREFRKIATGTTSVAAIYSRDLVKCRVHLPPLPEQRKIAKILTTVDSLIEKTEALIAKYRSVKQGLMHDLFTRGVDEHGRLRPTYAQSPHLYNKSELGWIPKEWRVASIGELFDKRTEHGKPGLPVMSIVMIDGLVERSSVDRRVESNLPPQGHALVLKGDIAYNMMRMWQGVLGRALFDCLVSPAYVVLKPKEAVNTHFAAYLFSDKRSILKFRQLSQGVVDDRLRLYFHDLVDITFAVPTSLDEQEETAGRIEACNRNIATETATVKQYRQMRLGLMQDLLTGKVRVKVDEAANV